MSGETINPEPNQEEISSGWDSLIEEKFAGEADSKSAPDWLTKDQLAELEAWKEWYRKNKQEHPDIPEKERLDTLKDALHYQFDLSFEEPDKLDQLLFAVVGEAGAVETTTEEPVDERIDGPEQLSETEREVVETWKKWYHDKKAQFPDTPEEDFKTAAASAIAYQLDLSEDNPKVETLYKMVIEG